MEISVLIVEDESVVALDLEQRLIGMGFHVAGHAHTGEKALGLARSNRPDVILMDIKLRGDLDGIETAGIIRREVDVPIIFLTAFSDAANLERAKRSDASGYILKPFQERELAIAIELALYKHNAERELRRNRALLDVTLNTVEEGVITIDRDDVILLMNRAAQRMTGWEESDAIGRSLGEIFRTCSESEADDACTEDIESGEPLVVLRDRSGAERLVEVSQKDIESGGVSISYRVLVFRDVTLELENRRTLLAAKEEAETAARARGDFLARVSHELRTPLNSILGMVQLARQLDAGDGELTEYLDILSGSSESLMALISDLLDYARSDSGGITVRRERFDLVNAIESVGKSHAMDAHRRGLRLINVIDSAVPRIVFGDEQRVIQILGNLLSNAVKFTNHGYVSLTVTPGVEPQHIRFSVKDTGIGIPSDRQEAVFEDFSQLDDPSTRSAGGVGLGLAIVRRLILAMGGSVDLQSTFGNGSTFTVDIPLSPADRSHGAEETNRGRDAVRIVRTNDELVERVWRPLCENRNVTLKRYDTPALWKACRGDELLVVNRSAINALADDPDDGDREYLRNYGVDIVVIDTLHDARDLPDVPGLNIAHLKEPVRHDVIERLLAGRFEEMYTDEHRLDPDRIGEHYLKSDRILDILVVNDERGEGNGCVSILRDLGHRVTLVGNGWAVREELRRVRFHAVIFDLESVDDTTSRLASWIRGRTVAISEREVTLVVLIDRDLAEGVRTSEGDFDVVVAKPFTVEAALEVTRAVALDDTVHIGRGRRRGRDDGVKALQEALAAGSLDRATDILHQIRETASSAEEEEALFRILLALRRGDMEKGVALLMKLKEERKV